MKNKSKTIIGRLESIGLPELAIENLEVRVDTGAKTSSLHVDNIQEIEKEDDLWIEFEMHPDVYDINEIVRKSAKVVEIKGVKSSTATREQRYLIHTEVVMAGQAWNIRLTLTDRS